MRRLLPLLAVALLCTAASTDEGDGLLDRALPRIERLYLHPDAVDPKVMVRAAIQRMERESPDVLVLEDGPNRLQVWSGDRGHVFETGDVLTLDDAHRRIDQVIAFIVEGRTGDDVIERDELVIEALGGMLTTIDRHSRLIVGDGLDEFNTRFKGTLVGIGSKIGRRAGELKIVDPFPDAPAGRAGLAAGDVISHIDGHDTAAMTVDDAVDRIRGPEGVPVVLTIRRPGEDGRRVFVIVRAKVLVPSVESELLAGGVGLIAIDHFSQKTSKEVADHIDELRGEAGDDLRGLVIDLRGNTGGSMRHAARIVSYFVEEGTLVKTEGKDGGAVHKLTREIPADPSQLRWAGPVAVLADRRTASGSEIVAGGLKYLDRSVTIGTQSFGKGTVQKVYPLRKEGKRVSMKLTVARYLLPGDSFVNTVGVTPDIVTGTIWLDPLEVSLPEELREPPEATGRQAGVGGLDARRNPGGGREPLRDGVNAAPELHLWYPRVVGDWGGAPLEAVEEAAKEEVTSEEATSPPPPVEVPGWSDVIGDAGEPLFNDMELRLAHEILLVAGPDDRRAELIEHARPVVAEWQRLQADRMATESQRAELTWASDPIPRWMDRAPAREEELQQRMRGEAPAGLAATLHLPDDFVAGEEANIRLEVRNDRDATVHHLRATVESSTKILDGAAFLIGDLEPGQSRSWTMPLQVSTSHRSRLDQWRLYLIDDEGPLGGPFRGTASTRGTARPELALQVATKAEPQEDGSSLVVAKIGIRNDGHGAAGEVQVHFGDPKLDTVERLEQFASLPELGPGDSAEVELSLRVRNPEALTVVPVRLRARDKRSTAATTVALDIPSAGRWTTDWKQPPSITLTSPSSTDGAAPSRGGEDFRIAGRVAAEGGVESVEISVAADQVFSRRVSGESAVSFEAPAVLEVGPNRIYVVAVGVDGAEVRRTFWVFGEKKLAE